MESTTKTGVHYLTDARASQFTVQVFSGGLLSAFGHSPKIAIRDFSGEAEVNPDDIEHSSLKITIKAEALAVTDDISDKDRREIERVMQMDILETSAYPEIVYECSNIAANKAGEGQYPVTLNGNLTMHGITRPVLLHVELLPEKNDASGSLHWKVTASLKRKSFGLSWNALIEASQAVGDDISIRMNIATPAR